MRKQQQQPSDDTIWMKSSIGKPNETTKPRKNMQMKAQSSTKFWYYWVLPSFTRFYWVLLGFTGFYWRSTSVNQSQVEEEQNEEEKNGVQKGSGRRKSHRQANQWRRRHLHRNDPRRRLDIFAFGRPWLSFFGVSHWGGAPFAVSRNRTAMKTAPVPIRHTRPNPRKTR